MTEFPAQVDLGVAAIARVYDDLLGGKDNYWVDRKLTDRLRVRCPLLPTILRLANEFVHEAVIGLVGEGITQFVDMGTGYPREPTLHAEILARQPCARIVYLDNDPVIAAHTRALMLPCDATAFVLADFTDTVELGATLGDQLDLSKPVGLVAESVLEFLPEAAKTVAGWAELLAPGSRLVISHLASDLCPEVGLLREEFDPHGFELCPRDRDELTEMLTGYTLTGRGIAPVHEWVGDTDFARPSRRDQPGCYGVVAELP